MSEEKKCEPCGSELVVQLADAMHCNACGHDEPIKTHLYGTPMNPKRAEKKSNPMQLGSTQP